ncbi:MAG: acVLRF1 family peptidyl-tRNA hydrolase [Nocardioides sp.]|uniref:acVLRF1 family peptidyl-tRNA hydrolase n=1 Tax=Nocardioides sp. TaxID=35761 RepID=UPI0039E3980A
MRVAVPSARFARWTANFADRHGGTTLTVTDGALHGTAPDGSTFTARLPFDGQYDAAPDAASFAEAAKHPATWGVLLVRKGGFAIARLADDQLAAHKIGQRHVQGRTKAGGQSQQRFSRRRDNQARQAFEAAADHAARLLDGVSTVVVGGDRAAVAEVLGDRRLAGLTPVAPWLDVPDPRRRELDRAIQEAVAIQVEVVNA